MKIDDLRILVVDDNPTDRTVLCAMLKTFGVANAHHAESVGNAKFKIINAHKIKSDFSLVICDWEMPNGEGVELLRFMRQDPRFKGVGFFVMTATPGPERVSAAIKNHADDFLVKPIAREQLNQKIAEYMSQVCKFVPKA